MKHIIITPKWIPCAEAMPTEGEEVLVSYPNRNIQVTTDCWYKTNGGRFCLADIYGDPTHWMPLPKPPKGVTA